MRLTLAITLALFCADGALGIAIETVPVGDMGNANDPGTFNLYGGVSYPYRIGKYEITVGEYTAFLNAVAKIDTYGLYNWNMGRDPWVAGIRQNGVSGGGSYSVIGSPNHPVTYVSWGDAARFANWLHNGQPTGPQNASTTEDGAYTLNGAMTDEALNVVPRNTGARWFIPSENEWYKAAYYQPAANGGDADNYWLYPLRTNNEPYSSKPPGSTPDNTRVANFFVNDGVANGYDDGYAVTDCNCLNVDQNYLTDVGAYTSASTYYGTFDQAGNVWEWNDDSRGANSKRGLRGGSWYDIYWYTDAPYGVDSRSLVENFTIGFRVASAAVPEPSACLLFASAAPLLFSSRRRVRPIPAAR